MKLSDKLKSHRKKQGKTTQQMADDLGLPVSTYRGYEYGARVPADLIPKMCQLLGITPNQLFEIEVKKINLDHHAKLQICIEQVQKVLTMLSEIYSDRINYKTV